MGINAFSAPGRFWRGNLHTHSSRSDGALAPDEVCARYRDAGYDFLCLSDHFLSRYGFPVTDTRDFRTNRFTTILGAELHAMANSQGELWHILAAGLPEDFAETGETESGVDLAARARAAGAFVGIAHPQWSGLSEEDGRAMAPHAHAVEIFNYTCDIECARPDGAVMLDQLLNEGYRLGGYAADDAHFNFPDAFGAWTMVKAPENQPEALVDALKAGLYYSSQGPLIHDFAIDGEEVVVECSQAENVAVLGRGTRARNQRGEGLASVRLPFEPFRDDWLRVVVTDAAGRMAWTNPVWAGS
ncbi:CehA/McbA family metallohydrolase [Afifella sp. IM 167]|uniref:CehA/McbA family metallohydrolase n=1 Tax=Afifella sp. IM 167 TaxID=2033586 RepID=UPI001CCE05F3|nr:CehA/McbA family metallohydrolase [Afifella sp. IM 167]MBZ8132038.1 phosphotransferase [Afifella sp. IM 167]